MRFFAIMNICKIESEMMIKASFMVIRWEPFVIILLVNRESLLRSKFENLILFDKSFKVDAFITF